MYYSTKNNQIKDRNLAKMYIIQIEFQNQTINSEKLGIFRSCFSRANEEIIRLYGKRWGIEVFFKMCKQHLKLVKEIQIRNYDGLSKIYIS